MIHYMPLDLDRVPRRLLHLPHENPFTSTTDPSKVDCRICRKIIDGPLTVEQVQRRVDAILKLKAHDDARVSAEIQLYRDVLQAIMERTDYPVQLAEAALDLEPDDG